MCRRRAGSPLLEHLDIPTQELYDGLDTGLYERTFTLALDDISFSVDDLSDFHGLQALIGDAAFEQVIRDAGIARRHGTYKGVRDLQLDYLVRGGHMLVFAIGELSPGRYQLALQGVWRLA